MSKIYDFAKGKGFSFEHEYINIQGWPVQLVEASHSPLWTEAIKTAELMPLDDIRVKVIDPEHLAAMWIFASHKKDIRKIEMFDEAE